MPPKKSNNVYLQSRSDATTQTEQGELLILKHVQDLDKGSTTVGPSNGTGESDLAKTKLLLTAINAISKVNRSTVTNHKQAVACLSEAARRSKLMKGDYDSTVNRTRDDVGILVSSFNKLKMETMQGLSQQNDLLEEERRKSKKMHESYKAKLDEFKAKLKIAENEIALKSAENEALARKVATAEQDVVTAKESEDDMRKKLDDKLFLASNQKCSSCSASEKVRSMLTSDIASKDREIGMAKNDIQLLQEQVLEQKSLVGILSKELEKARSETRAWRSQYESAVKELKELKTFKTKNASEKRTNTVDKRSKTSPTVAEPPSSIITPPDSEKSKDSPPISEPANSPMYQAPNRIPKKQNIKSFEQSLNATNSQKSQASTNASDNGSKRLSSEFVQKTGPIKRKKLSEVANSNLITIRPTSAANPSSSTARPNSSQQCNQGVRQQEASLFAKTLNNIHAEFCAPAPQSSHQLYNRPNAPRPSVFLPRPPVPPKDLPKPPTNKIPRPPIPPPPSVMGFNSHNGSKVTPPPIDKSKIPAPPAPPSMSRMPRPPPPHTLVNPSRTLPWHSSGGGGGRSSASGHNSWMHQN